MFQKALRIAITFSLLLAGYAGYVRGYAVVARWLGPAQTVPIVPFNPSLSVTGRETKKLAEAAFGPGHWSTDPKQSVWYYDAERGFWMFFKTYTRKNDGKRITFTPFALIWKSKNSDRALKTVLGDSADVDFDKPFDLGREGGEPARVVHARIDGDVRLRDDKGTPDRPEDDLTIALQYVEYDEKMLQVRALESPVVLREGDTTLDGFGVLIDLWPNDPRPDGRPAPGFHGARQARVLKNVDINVKDVGQAGIVPGAAARTAEDKAGEKDPVPGRLRSDGPLVIDFPKPKPKPADPKAPPPPPSPPEPTYAHFSRNVIIEQGDPAAPDRCDADNLYLTLLPAEQPAGAKAKEQPAKDDEGESGSLSKLTLHRAKATGHAVWLRSLGQGIEGRGNELIYERNAPQAPDRIYFRGDNYTRIEKTNLVKRGPDVGKVESIDTIRTIDVTIYQGIKPEDPDTVVAGGPGSLETRAAKDKPVERSAHWRDKLLVQTIGEGADQRKKVTLIGSPDIDSPSQGNMKARDKIIAYLKPKPKADKPAAEAGTAEALQIDWVEALGNVHVVTATAPEKPGGAPRPSRTLDAKERLDIVFLEPPAAQAAPPAAAPATRPPTPAEPAGDFIAADEPKAPEQPGPADEPAKPAPAIEAAADRVYAWVRMTPGEDAKTKGDFEKVYLRGHAFIHQDPKVEGEKGTDVTADDIDLFSKGNGLVFVEAHGAPAEVVTDGRTISGPVLGLDQTEDHAWVRGPGRYFQAARPPKPRAAKEGEDPAEAKPARADGLKPGNGPMEITWRDEMQFHGRPIDENGEVENARADFFGKVLARTVDAAIDGDEMVASLDQPVPFVRPKRDPKAEPADEPKPQIVEVRALKNVHLVKIDRDPKTRIEVARKRVNGEDVTYNNADGTFEVIGAGVMRDGRRKQPGGRPGPLGGGPAVATVADSDRPNVRLKPAVGTGGGAGSPKGKDAKIAPSAFEMTQIEFAKGVTGTIDGLDAGPGMKAGFAADFLGPIRVIQAPVPALNVTLDPDNPPADYYIATSETLKYVQEPTVDGRPAHGYLKMMGNASAHTPKEALQGDEITYDTVKELSCVYGHEGPLRIVSQDGVGQPYSAGRGSVVVYNHKTGERKIKDPKNFVFIDPRSRGRANALPDFKRDRAPAAGPANVAANGPSTPARGPSSAPRRGAANTAVASRTPAAAEAEDVDPSTIPKKPKRVPMRLAPRNDKERRSFNGR